jgi:hypothetical protein
LFARRRWADAHSRCDVAVPEPMKNQFFCGIVSTEWYPSTVDKKLGLNRRQADERQIAVAIERENASCK